MTLLVEDGSGLIDSESYISVADASLYHQAHGNSAWVDFGSDEQEPALRRATEWIDRTFRGSFVGHRRKFREQALEWPRIGAFINFADNGFFSRYASYSGLSVLLSDNELPGELLRATCEAALRELQTPGVLYPDIVPGRIIKSVAISGAVSVTYADTSPQGQHTIISIIGAILSPLLVNTGESSMFGTSARRN